MLQLNLYYIITLCQDVNKSKTSSKQTSLNPTTSANCIVFFSHLIQILNSTEPFTIMHQATAHFFQMPFIHKRVIAAQTSQTSISASLTVKLFQNSFTHVFIIHSLHRCTKLFLQIPGLKCRCHSFIHRLY